jgi:ribosome-associated translation inhibitor RaiA
MQMSCATMARHMRTAEHLTAIDTRLDRLDANIDGRFREVDERFERIDRRFEQVDRRLEQIDRRFDEQRAHTSALFEASRVDFNNLYDFVKAQAERTDARLDRIQVEALTSAADLHAAIAALTPRIRRTRRRR